MDDEFFYGGSDTSISSEIPVSLSSPSVRSNNDSNNNFTMTPNTYKTYRNRTVGKLNKNFNSNPEHEKISYLNSQLLEDDEALEFDESNAYESSRPHFSNTKFKKDALKTFSKLKSNKVERKSFLSNIQPNDTGNARLKIVLMILNFFFKESSLNDTSLMDYETTSNSNNPYFKHKNKYNDEEKERVRKPVQNVQQAERLDSTSLLQKPSNCFPLTSIMHKFQNSKIKFSNTNHQEDSLASKEN